MSSDVEDYFVHSVNRSDQQYQITINATSAAKAFVVLLLGLPGAPTLTASYFTCPTPAQRRHHAKSRNDCRLYLVNTSKTVAMTGYPATIPDAQNLFYMQNAGYGTKYIKVSCP